MEVHHHPDLHHRRKKFKEYFLEFLMIFMAVTLGFLAESLRENIGDKNKEKEYIVSFINNLKDDTAHLNDVLQENDTKIGNLHKLLSLTRANLADTGVRRAIYRYCVDNGVNYYSEFKGSDATMMQLKNSGGLRLIRRDHVADSIAEYDNCLKAIYAAEELYNSSTNAAELATQEVIDYTVFYDSTRYNDGQFKGGLLPFLTEDPKKIHWMFNKINYEISGTRNYLENIRKQMPFIDRLIPFLKKEYDLE